MLPTGLENYHVIDLVGEGSFGKVSKAAYIGTLEALLAALRGIHDVIAMEGLQRACTQSFLDHAGLQRETAMHGPDHGHEVHCQAWQIRKGYTEPAAGD